MEPAQSFDCDLAAAPAWTPLRRRIEQGRRPSEMLAETQPAATKRRKEGMNCRRGQFSVEMAITAHAALCAVHRKSLAEGSAAAYSSVHCNEPNKRTDDENHLHPSPNPGSAVRPRYEHRCARWHSERDAVHAKGRNADHLDGACRYHRTRGQLSSRTGARSARSCCAARRG